MKMIWAKIKIVAIRHPEMVTVETNIRTGVLQELSRDELVMLTLGANLATGNKLISGGKLYERYYYKEPGFQWARVAADVLEIDEHHLTCGRPRTQRTLLAPDDLGIRHYTREPKKNYRTIPAIQAGSENVIFL